MKAQIAQAQKELENATKAFNQIKEQAEAQAKQIGQARTTLFASPIGRAYYEARGDWNKKVSATLTQYFPGQASQLAAQQNEANTSAQSSLSTSDASQRFTRLAEFRSELSAFRSEIQTACDTMKEPKKSQCRNAIGLVNTSGTNYDSSLSKAVSSNFVLNATLLSKIAAAQQTIQSLEGSTQSASSLVEQKSSAYENAVQRFVAEMKNLEKDKTSLNEKVSKKKEELATVEQAYNQLVRQRENDLETNREKYLNEQQDLEQKNVALAEHIDGLKWRLEQLDDTLTVLNADKKALTEKLAKKTDDKKELEQRKKELEAAQKGYEKKAKEYADTIKKLEEERKKLEDELKKKKEELDKTNEPNRSASGPLVYYIPPPLEKIIKDTTKFNAFKDSVNAAEKELTAAKEFKAAAQGKLLRQYETIARELMNYRSASNEKESTEKKITELKRELEEKKGKETLGYQKAIDDAQKLIASAEDQKKKAEDHLQEAKNDSARLSKELEEKRKKRDEIDKHLMQYDQDVKTLEAQYDYEDGQLKKINATVKSLSDDLKKERQKLDEIQLALGRTREEQTRAHARDDQQLIEAANAAVQAKQAELALLKTKVESLENQLRSAKESQQSATLRVQNANKALQDKFPEYAELKKKYKKEDDELFHLNEEYQEALSKLKLWQGIVDKAEDVVERMKMKKDDAIERMQEAVNKKTKSEDVEEEVAELEDQVKKLDDTLNKSVEFGNKARDEKKKIEDEADDRWKQAKEHLKNAKEDLRKYLVNEFNHPRNTDTLKLTAEDKPLDGWRTKDGPAETIGYIKYVNDRTPILDATVASVDLPEKKKNSVCNPFVEYLPIPDPSKVKPQFVTPEPRTIALLYKNGEPLWYEWPVISAAEPVISKDVVQLLATGSDDDSFVRKCIAMDSECPPIIDPPKAIKDNMTYQWDGDGRYINGRIYEFVYWEPKDVENPLCTKPLQFTTQYIANGLASDPVLNDDNIKEVVPGVLIEVPDSIVGAPNEKIQLRPRIVKGDHSGLSGETVEFKVEKKSGESKGFGVNPAKKETDGAGYAEVEFDFGDGYARFDITVKWKRGGTTCKEKHIDAIAPLYMQFLKAGMGPPAIVWDAADGVWNGGDFKSKADAFLKQTEKSKEDELENEVEGIVGVYDENRDRKNGIEIEFKRLPNGKVDPGKKKTEKFGIARTVALDVKEDEEISFHADIAKKYKDVTRPPEVEKSTSTKKIKKFKIGIGSDLFVVELDEPANRGETINGSGKLEITTGGIIDNINGVLNDLELTIEEVTLEESDDEVPKAVTGAVSWKKEDGLKTTIFSFEVSLDQLGITADSGAVIAGKIKSPTMPKAKGEDDDEEAEPTPMKFTAELNLSGDFYGEVSDFPKFSFRGFGLKEGASFVLDMHKGKSATGFKNEFVGVVIRKASLELPKIFRRKDSEVPTVLSVEDLGIGKYGAAGGFGIQGTVKLEGSFFKIGFSGYEFEANAVSLTFKDGTVDGSFGGKLSLPVPFEGALDLSIEKSGDEWSGNIKTSEPVSIPRLRTVFSILDGTGISWNAAEKIGMLSINAVITTEKVGQVKIYGFKVDSKGSIQTEKISIGKAIKFCEGFDFQLESLAFAKTEEEYSIELEGAFGFPIIKQLEGSIKVEPGPTVSAKLKKVEIEFEKSPVEFKGKLEFGKNEFRGEFDIGIKNLASKGGGEGITGMLIFGTQKVNETQNFTYWYAELILRASIPLGQTGLSLLALGGGLGYNYDPPIGSQPGSPRNSESFSFKALISAGNTPSGELFAGRLTLVLTDQRFSINGKVWLLSKEDAIFGEGQLNLYWSPAKLDGFIQMYVGLPTSEGKVFRFQGKINYYFPGTDDFYIKSEEISGAVFNALKAEAKLQIDKELVRMNGRMYYNLNKTFGFGVVDVKVQLDVSVAGGFSYTYKSSTLDTPANFNGSWDVNIDTPVGEYDLISGTINLATHLTASPSMVQLTGTAYVSWNVLFYSGSATLDVGFSAAI